MSDTKPALPMRIRKLIGTSVLVLWLIVYTLLAAALATASFFPQNALVQFVYYLIAGFAWIIPVRYLLRWMQRPDD